MTMACHSLFSKDVIQGLNRWRDNLTAAAQLQTAAQAEAESTDEATLAANRRSAIEAARNLGAAVA